MLQQKTWLILVLALLFYKDVYDQPNYKIVVSKGTAYEEYFSSADPVKNPVQAELWKRMKENPNSAMTSTQEIESLLLDSQAEQALKNSQVFHL